MIQWSMKFDMYISDIHYTYTLPRHYDREKYSIIQKTKNIPCRSMLHIPFCFSISTVSKREIVWEASGEQSWTVDNRRLVVIVYKGYFDGLDSDVDGNVLKKHNTHTHISTF